MPSDWPAWLLAVALASVPATLYSIARVIEALNRKKTMDDLTKLTAAVATNGSDVDALIAKATGNSQQPAIDALTAELDAQHAKAEAALNPPVPLAVIPTTLAVTVGAAVADQLTVTGGTAPYAFDPGTSGLSVDSAGAVTGSVAAAGDSTITVTDAAGGSLSVAVTAS